MKWEGLDGLPVDLQCGSPPRDTQLAGHVEILYAYLPSPVHKAVTEIVQNFKPLYAQDLVKRDLQNGGDLANQ
jgi:hypothetical protein